MAWEKPFRIPLLGAVMRAYGAVPVDMKRPGKDSFAEAVRILRRGEALGIFPEGGRTRGGQLMNPIKHGMARLAHLTGAPIVPATISGGRRVWPKKQFLPEPGPIRVTFHQPVRAAAGGEGASRRRDRALEADVIARVLDAIHSTLGPARRAEERIERLLRSRPKPPSLWVEGIPFTLFAAAGLFISSDAWWRYAAPGAPALVLLLAVIVAEQLSGARSRTLKGARNLGPWAVLLCLGFAAREALAWWELALWAAGLAALIWVQVFRFSAYRRARAAALLLAYLGWLLRLGAIGR